MKTIREKLIALKIGTMIRWDGKTYEVLAVVYRDESKKLCRTDVRILEVGRERFVDVPGRFLAAGKMIRLDNSLYMTWFAQKNCNFEIL